MYVNTPVVPISDIISGPVSGEACTVQIQRLSRFNPLYEATVLIGQTTYYFRSRTGYYWYERGTGRIPSGVLNSLITETYRASQEGAFDA